MASHDETGGMPPDSGLLLVGHGSRDEAGIGELHATARLVAQAARPCPVEPCFLEFARPTIAEGFRKLVARGARRIVVTPALLFSAGHARRDIPAAVAAVAAEHRGIAWAQSEHLGCHPALVSLSALRYREAVAAAARTTDDATTLVMVGRGSHDPAATEEMCRFVALRRESTPVADARACFLTMAEPRLETVLDRMARAGAKRVVVQPHLLFCGVLFDRARATVARYGIEHPEVEWLTTSYLGPEAGVAQALVDRAEATRIPVSG